MQFADADIPDTVLDLPPIDDIFKGAGTDGVLVDQYGTTIDTRPGTTQIPSTPEEQMQLFTKSSAIAYPLGDPAYIVFLYEHSSALRQCIDAYMVNIHGFGDRLEPVVDLTAEDADEQIRDLLWLRRCTDDDDEPPQPTDAEVAAERKQFEISMRLEKLRIAQFLDHAFVDRSFAEGRMETCQDEELLGNAYWEVQRSEKGRIVGLALVPSFTVRLLPLDLDAHPRVMRKRRGVDIVEETIIDHRARRFVQVVNHLQVYFKEFGDTRVLSRNHGEYYKTVEDMRRVDPQDEPAAELVHFSIHSSRSPYGVPRWIGTMLTLIGLRECEETNRDYWENKSVPPLAITLAGCHMNDDQTRRLEDAIKNRIKGRQNFHKILVVQGAADMSPEGRPARSEIKFWPLMNAQLQEALHPGYDLRCTDKTGQTFRLARPLRGDMQDVNRAAYEAALEFAELQVFAPERQRFDDFMNRIIWPAMGFRFWRYASKGPMPKDSGQMAELIVKMAQAGLTFNQAFAVMSDVFNKVIPQIDAPWANLPINLMLKTPDWTQFVAGAQAEKPANGEAPVEPTDDEEAPNDEEPDLEKQVAGIIKLRDALAKREADAAAAAFHTEP